jgi:hypothetical protein
MMNNPSAKLAELVNQLPDPDPTKKFTGPDPADARRIYDDVLQGGRDSIVGLVGMLVEAGKGEDWKVRYLIHGLVLYAGRPEKDAYRPMIAEALASQLGGALPKEVTCFLLQELQIVGRKEVVPAISRQLLDEETCDPAARALLSIRDGAVEQFRAALPKVRGRCRVTILQALGVLADQASVDALRTALGDTDREVRLTAAFGLARLADAGSADLLLKAAQAKEIWERDQMAGACLVLAEGLLASGKKSEARRIYQRLVDTCANPEDRHLRQAASLGLTASEK